MNTANLIIVSADKLNAETLRLALESPHINIECFDTTECLLDFCCLHSVELIIFLSVTPYFTSMNIVEHLRREMCGSVPTIFVVSHSHSHSTILTLLECGVAQYMTFPLNLHRLRSKVHNLLIEN